MSHDQPTTISSRSTTRRRRRGSGQRAQSMVEFALILPIFLLVIMAIVDFSWALRTDIIITNAAREGARAGAVGSNVATVKSTAVDRSAGLLTTADVTVGGVPGTSGGIVTVTATHDYSFITPLGGFLTFVTGGAIDNPLPLSATTKMRLE